MHMMWMLIVPIGLQILFFIRKLCYKDVEIIFTQSGSVIKKENGKKTNFYKTPDLIWNPLKHFDLKDHLGINLRCRRGKLHSWLSNRKKNDKIYSVYCAVFVLNFWILFLLQSKLYGPVTELLSKHPVTLCIMI